MGTITPLYLQLASDPVYATTADTLNDFGRDGGCVRAMATFGLTQSMN